MSSASALAGAGVSGREAEVLALLGEHLSHAEIAGRLFISVRTVESHVASLRRKLGVAGHRDLVGLAVSYRAASLGTKSPAPARLPSPLTSFVGRDGERAALAAALGRSRLVSAVGPGGIGKTRLALAVAAAEASRFADGTWYVDLVPVIDPAQLPGVVLAVTGLGDSSSRPAQDVLAATVGEQRALLVLDNCEHLVNAVAVLTEWLLSACPNLAVLLTSRVRLVVPHEAVYAVPGLSLPPPGEEGGDATALFAERAAAAGAPLADGTARRRAAGICRALGGLPLAIELAAARLPSLGLARQSGDPLLISAALDAATAGLMARGEISAAADIADERISTLPLLARDPRAALELKDALHTAIFTGVAAGHLRRSLDLAERHYGLPFLREERDLGGEDLLAPAALAGQWDRVTALGEQWQRGWERAGRPVAPGRGLAPAAAALVHGLRGDDPPRTAWLAILAAVRGVGEEQAVPGSGCAEVFEAIVFLHRGQPHEAMRLLADAGGSRDSWRRRLWHQWMTALRAEAAVLARDPGADRHLAAARAAADRNPVALALTQRAEALARGDRAAVLATAAAFTQAGYPYQESRTLLLADPMPRD